MITSNNRSHTVLLALSALALGGCPGLGSDDPPPHASGFGEDTDHPPDDSGDSTAGADTTDGPIDPTNAGDDGGEPPPPEAELCDAGDEA